MTSHAAPQPDALFVIIPALTLPTQLAAFSYISMFVVGTVSAMGGYTAVIGEPHLPHAGTGVPRRCSLPGHRLHAKGCWPSSRCLSEDALRSVQHDSVIIQTNVLLLAEARRLSARLHSWRRRDVKGDPGTQSVADNKSVGAGVVRRDCHWRAGPPQLGLFSA